VRDRCLGQLAGFDRHVGADLGVGIAIGRDHVIDAGVEPQDDARSDAVDDAAAVAELVALVGEHLDRDRVRRGWLAVADESREPQAAGIQHEPLRRGLALLDGDPPCHVGAPESGVDQVVAGRHADRRRGDAAVGDEPRPAVRSALPRKTRQRTPLSMRCPSSVRRAVRLICPMPAGIGAAGAACGAAGVAFGTTVVLPLPTGWSGIVVRNGALVLHELAAVGCWARAGVARLGPHARGSAAIQISTDRKPALCYRLTPAAHR
jgi:hypothetical protein